MSSSTCSRSSAIELLSATHEVLRRVLLLRVQHGANRRLARPTAGCRAAPGPRRARAARRTSRGSSGGRAGRRGSSAGRGPSSTARRWPARPRRRGPPGSGRASGSAAAAAAAPIALDDRGRRGRRATAGAERPEDAPRPRPPRRDPRRRRRSGRRRAGCGRCRTGPGTRSQMPRLPRPGGAPRPGRPSSAACSSSPAASPGSSRRWSATSNDHRRVRPPRRGRPARAPRARRRCAGRPASSRRRAPGPGRPAGAPRPGRRGRWRPASPMQRRGQAGWSPRRRPRGPRARRRPGEEQVAAQGVQRALAGQRVGDRRRADPLVDVARRREVGERLLEPTDALLGPAAVDQGARLERREPDGLGQADRAVEDLERVVRTGPASSAEGAHAPFRMRTTWSVSPARSAAASAASNAWRARPGRWSRSWLMPIGRVRRRERPLVVAAVCAREGPLGRLAAGRDVAAVVVGRGDPRVQQRFVGRLASHRRRPASRSPGPRRRRRAGHG